MTPNNLTLKLEQLKDNLDDIGRCVYYAKSFYPTKDVEAQLDRILVILGINSPKDVGLSLSILRK